jgi:hypothetical protein
MGLSVLPGTIEWWAIRLLWLGVLFVVLLLFILVFGRYEHPARRQAAAGLSTSRVVIGTLLLSLGLALLVTGGISAEGAIGLRLEVVLTTFIESFLLLRIGSFNHHGSA